MNPSLRSHRAHPTATFGDFIRGGPAGRLLPAESSRFHYTYNARGAIFQFLAGLPRNGRDTVLVPAFHCPTVVTPALHAGYKVRFYGIREDLTTDWADLMESLHADVAAVVVINYFGFAADLGTLMQARRNGRFYVIEDCSHSFLQVNPLELTGSRGDVSVYSFWKLVPSMVGGALRMNNQDLELALRSGPVPLKDSLVRSKRIIEEAVNNLESSSLKDAFNYLEGQRVRLKAAMGAKPPPGARHLPEDALNGCEFDERLASAAMPFLSSLILRRTDLRAMAERRRRNFRRWSEKLVTSARLRMLHTTLPDTICPWAFPVILERRSELDYRLRELGVPLFTFGETPHPLLARCAPRSALVGANSLAGNLLCLPVHQNLHEEHIDACAATINEFIHSS